MRRDTSRSRLVIGLLVAAALALIVLDSREGADPVTTAARDAGELAFAPVASGVTAATAPVRDAYTALAAAPGARDRIADLEERNRELRTELAARDRDARRAEKLDDLLQLSGMGGYEIVPAQAVTRVTARGFSDAVTLDVGREDGVREDMTVINGDGLVGRVTHAGRTTSTVLPAVDRSSAVGARLEGSQEIGVAEGTGAVGGSKPMSFELMSADARMKPGQRIVTLGSHDNAPFVPGVPVGTITSVNETPGSLTRTGHARPAVDFGSLDVVGVIVAGPQDDPRDSLLPGPPREAPEPEKAGDEADSQDSESASDTGESGDPEEGRR
ncbi:rod shape-determining protein MreC [Streptomonospora sp. S1-112]|uniref:Cell shape-determining protein MreC n=1 Tax=Streptomonospora mangrovi TaxID=2883123 RepID=A0A9X3NQL3_9ACTN|nr:rod shape-determining protein MreC [Streptomonospora mangrovi]MDA0564950.1 rod shape-determining protein MreC [Streptomonospora mangrovi]